MILQKLHHTSSQFVEMERYEESSEKERSRRHDGPDRRREEPRDRGGERGRRDRSRSNSPKRKDRDDRDRHQRPKHDEPRGHYRGDRDRPNRPRSHYGDDKPDRHPGVRLERLRPSDDRSEGDKGEGDERLRRRDERNHDRVERRGRRPGERNSPDSHHDGSYQRKRRRPDREEEDISQYKFEGATKEGTSGDKEEGAKEDGPNYALSGKLTAETNTYRGVVIKYNEPEEARIPKTRWRLYGFKGDETLPTLYMHRQSAYLVGRNRKVVDFPVDHPSCSGQHAVLQYRLVEYEKVDGSTGKKVKPYIIDLESTNGTYVNNNRIDAARYYELKEGDMIKFGFSSREYVLLHENSQTDKVDEQPDQEGEGV